MIESTTYKKLTFTAADSYSKDQQCPHTDAGSTNWKQVQVL